MVFTTRDYIALVGMLFLCLLFDWWAAVLFGLGAMFYRMGEEIDKDNAD